jgi:hypothetical protein
MRVILKITLRLILKTSLAHIHLCCLDFSIYDKDIEVIDPSGVKLYGVNNYKSAFHLLHAIVGIFYCPERSSLSFRMCYDKARQDIRIHWNAQVIPKAIFGGYKTTLHVDGISVYVLGRESGNITQHRVERLIINDVSIMPEQGILSALRQYAIKKDIDSVPVFFNSDSTLSSLNEKDLHMFKFQNFSPVSTRSLLFESDVQRSAVSSSSGNMDWDALERKNASRKKFGLNPLTPEEYTELQDQVDELDKTVQKRAAAAAADLANKKEKEEGGFLKKLFGKALENTCESNFDCDRPQVCCDFKIKKMCCTSGNLVVNGPIDRTGQLAELPVLANPDNYPPIQPRRRY